MKNSIGLIFIFFLIAFWEVYSTYLDYPVFFPPVTQIFLSFINLFANETFIESAIFTLTRCLIAFFIASLIGIALGITLGRIKFLYSLINKWKERIVSENEYLKEYKNKHHQKIMNI